MLSDIHEGRSSDYNLLEAAQTLSDHMELASPLESDDARRSSEFSLIDNIAEVFPDMVHKSPEPLSSPSEIEISRKSEGSFHEADLVGVSLDALIHHILLQASVRVPSVFLTELMVL